MLKSSEWRIRYATLAETNTRTEDSRTPVVFLQSLHNEDFEAAVSYTHLTLPTIYSV